MMRIIERNVKGALIADLDQIWHRSVIMDGVGSGIGNHEQGFVRATRR